MSSKIRESRLIPYNLQAGYGAPTHLSPAGTLYFDYTEKTQYINKDSVDEWVKVANYSNLVSTNSVTATTYTLNVVSHTTYYGINVNSDVDLTLPSATDYEGYIIIVKDEGGYAKKHRIRITPYSGNIENTNYVDMNLNYMALQIIARNNNWWII